MKNIKLTNKEIRLIIEGLRLKNSHNLFKSCEEEAILIYKLKDKLEHDECNKDTIHNKSREDMKSFFRYRNSLKSKVDVNTLKVKVELDTSDIDNKLKDLRDELTSIYG